MPVKPTIVRAHRTVSATITLMLAHVRDVSDDIGDDSTPILSGRVDRPAIVHA